MTEIELHNLSKSYGQKVLFNNFNLRVESGEMIAIMGESGKGKSTLLNMIGLLESQDNGDIMIHGCKNPGISSRKTTLLQRNIIGYLFQNFALVDNMTVGQNLDIALQYAKVEDKQTAKAEALREVGLPNIMDQKIFTLSGGEQQRVAIARLMLKPCQLILADEPTGSLDARNRDAVSKLLCDLNAQGKTVLIVTHDKNVADICQRTIQL